jgi:hypothetical protein
VHSIFIAGLLALERRHRSCIAIVDAPPLYSDQSGDKKNTLHSTGEETKNAYKMLTVVTYGRTTLEWFKKQEMDIIKVVIEYKYRFRIKGFHDGAHYLRI